MKSKVLLLATLTLALAACGKSEEAAKSAPAPETAATSAPASSAPAQATPTPAAAANGLPQACEDYISKVESTIAKLPAEHRAMIEPQLKQALDQTRSALDTLGDEAAKTSACKQASDMFDQVTAQLPK